LWAGLKESQKLNLPKRAVPKELSLSSFRKSELCRVIVFFMLVGLSTPAGLLVDEPLEMVNMIEPAPETPVEDWSQPAY